MILARIEEIKIAMIQEITIPQCKYGNGRHLTNDMGMGSTNIALHRHRLKTEAQTKAGGQTEMLIWEN